MTLKEVAEIAKSAGVPMAYDHFDEDIAPPYLVYYYPSENDFIADGQNYANFRHVVFELFTAERDFEMEGDFEDELRDAGIVWYKSADYISDEKIYQITYETEVLINEQQQS